MLLANTTMWVACRLEVVGWTPMT